eukprot:2756016-Lingulodinium_polyedra.AAC.1
MAIWCTVTPLHRMKRCNSAWVGGATRDGSRWFFAVLRHCRPFALRAGVCHYLGLAQLGRHVDQQTEHISAHRNRSWARLCCT